MYKCYLFQMLTIWPIEAVTRLGIFISILSGNYPWTVEVCQKIQHNWWEQVGLILSSPTLALFTPFLYRQQNVPSTELIKETFLKTYSLHQVSFPFLSFIYKIISVTWEDTNTYLKRFWIGNDFYSFADTF